MNGCKAALDWQLIGVTLAGLFFFGLAFNGLVNALDERKSGYVSLLVAGGVLITLGGVAIVSWQCALLALAMFAASGTPMIIGEAARAVRKREAALRVLREGRNTERGNDD